MNEFPLLFNIIYLIIGLLQSFVAPRIRPNPYFGFKIGYTFSSREAWKKTNRFAGILITLHALVLLSLTPLWENHLDYYVITLVLPLVIIAIVGTIYASHRLEEERIEVRGPPRPMKTLEASLAWKYLGVILFLLLLCTMVFAYPVLPEKMTVHFDAYGNPNGWATKESFYVTYLLFATGYLALVYFIVYIGKKYPIAFHSGMMRIGRDTMFKATILSLDIVFIILIGTFIWMYFYNVGNVSSESVMVTYLIFVIFGVSFVPIAYIIYRWKKEKKEVKKYE